MSNPDWEIVMMRTRAERRHRIASVATAVGLTAFVIALFALFVMARHRADEDCRRRGGLVVHGYSHRGGYVHGCAER